MKILFEKIHKNGLLLPSVFIEILISSDLELIN